MVLYRLQDLLGDGTEGGQSQSFQVKIYVCGQIFGLISCDLFNQIYLIKSLDFKFSILGFSCLFPDEEAKIRVKNKRQKITMEKYIFMLTCFYLSLAECLFPEHEFQM